MSLRTAVGTFALVAVVLTVTPGLDTALVLRAAGPRPDGDLSGTAPAPAVWWAARLALLTDLAAPPHTSAPSTA